MDSTNTDMSITDNKTVRPYVLDRKNPKSNSQTSTLDKITLYLLGFITFIIPWFFTPFTYEYYEIAKNTLLILLVVVLIILWALKIALKKQFTFIRTPFDIPILLFLGSQILATIFSIYNQASLWGYYSRFTGGLISTIFLVILYFFVVNNVRSEAKIKTVLNISLVSLCLLSLFTVLNSLNLFNGIFSNISESNPSLSVLVSEAFSPVGNPNSLVFMFLLFLPLALSKIVSAKNVGKQIIFIVLSSILLLGIGISSISKPDFYSITIWVLTFGVIGFYAVRTYSVIKEKDSLLGFVPLILIAVFAAVFAVSSSVRKTIVEDVNFSRYTQAPFNTTWSVITGSIKENKVGGFLVGSGLDTYAYNYPKYKPLDQNFEPNWRKNYTRSTYQILDVLSNSGLLGFLAYSFFMVLVIFFIIRNVFRKLKKINKEVFIALGVMVILFVLFNFLTFFTITLQVSFWLILGLLVGSYHLLNKEEVDKLNFSLKVSKSENSLERENEVLPYIFLSLTVLLLSLFSFYILRNFAAEMKYKKSIVAVSYDSYDEANEYILNALATNRNRDYYHRQIAYVGLLTLKDNLINAENNKEKAMIISTNEKMINDGINNSIKINTNDPVNWETASVIYKELVNISQGEAYGTETLQAVSGAVEMNPFNPDNYIILGYIYQFNRDEELQNQAEQVFYRAYSLQPSYALSIFALGNYLEYVEKYDEAITLYEESLKSYYTADSEIGKYLEERVSIAMSKKAGKTEKDIQAEPTDEDINKQVEENVTP